MTGMSKAVMTTRDELILSQIEKNAPNGERYVLVAKIVYVGCALLVYARDDTVGRRLSNVQTQWTGFGPLYMGNKSAVGVRFTVKGGEGAADEVFTWVTAGVWVAGRVLRVSTDSSTPISRHINRMLSCGLWTTSVLSRPCCLTMRTGRSRLSTTRLISLSTETSTSGCTFLATIKRTDFSWEHLKATT